MFVNGNDLKMARTTSNWTQAEEAGRLGVTQAYLSMVERGSRPVRCQKSCISVR